MTDFEALWQAANDGDPAQQFALASHYADQADYGRSRRWFSRAAAGGFHRARVELGRQALMGLGMASSVSDAFTAFRLAADAGDAAGQFELAGMLYRGQDPAAGDHRDTARAAELLSASARSGLPVALINYALVSAQLGNQALAHNLLHCAAAAGEHRALQMVAGLPRPANPLDPQHWQSLADLTLPEATTVSANIAWADCSLKVFADLISPLECLYLKETARPDLLPSHTVHPLTGESVHDETRSSFGWSFHPSQEDIAIVRVKERLAAQAQQPYSHAEPFAMLRYLPGQQYREHFDFIDPQSGEAGQEIAHRGQRVATTFSYLTDVAAGGETDFPRFGQRIKPAAGTAVLFRNTLDDGNIDRNSLHASLPVIKGEKWLATLWFRDRPFLP